MPLANSFTSFVKQAFRIVLTQDTKESDHANGRVIAPISTRLGCQKSVAYRIAQKNANVQIARAQKIKAGDRANERPYVYIALKFQKERRRTGGRINDRPYLPFRVPKERRLSD
jgi:hypothetical protein